MVIYLKQIGYISIIFFFSIYSKALVNMHDGTKILKNCVKPKIALTEVYIMYNAMVLQNIHANGKFVQKPCYTEVSSKVRGITKKTMLSQKSH